MVFLALSTDTKSADGTQHVSASADIVDVPVILQDADAGAKPGRLHTVVKAALGKNLEKIMQYRSSFYNPSVTR